MKIIATETCIKYGFVKGDILEYSHDGIHGCILAKNITRPELTEKTRCGYSILNEYDYEIYDPAKHVKYIVESERIIRFLGIPIIKKTTTKRIPLHEVIGGR